MLVLLALVLSGCILLYYKHRSAQILDNIYSRTSHKLQNELIELIKLKQGGTASITLAISNDISVKEALLKKDKSLINFDQLIAELSKISDYKNIWIQVVDKDGYNFYRSWMEKKAATIC